MHLHEPSRHKAVRELVGRATATATSGMTYAEVRAGLSRAARTPPGNARLNPRGYRIALDDFEADWPTYLGVGPTARRIRHAGDLAETHFLKGYDAVQLAYALKLRRSITDQVL